MRPLVLTLALMVLACGSPDTAAEIRPDEPPAPAFDGALAGEAAARIRHGRRIADVLGCTGCHGAELQGERFYELYASNLTRELPGYTDAQLEVLLRDGVHPSGRDVWGMPSEIFQHLGEADLTALTAYLRTLRPAGPPTQPALPFDPETRQLIADGELMPAAQFVRQTRSTTPADLGPRHALGRYITMVTCAECHGPELEGREGDNPDLIVAGAYTRDQFETLMTTGVPLGGRELRLMGEVARGRFSRMTRHERDAIYDYLRARALQDRSETAS